MPFFCRCFKHHTPLFCVPYAVPSPLYLPYKKKIITYYLEKENFFCIFVVKLRILFPFHYY